MGLLYLGGVGSGKTKGNGGKPSARQAHHGWCETPSTCCSAEGNPDACTSTGYATAPPAKRGCRLEVPSAASGLKSTRLQLGPSEVAVAWTALGAQSTELLDSLLLAAHPAGARGALPLHHHPRPRALSQPPGSQTTALSPQCAFEIDHPLMCLHRFVINLLNCGPVRPGKPLRAANSTRGTLPYLPDLGMR